MIRSVIEVPFSHGRLANNSEEPDAISPVAIIYLERHLESQQEIDEY